MQEGKPSPFSLLLKSLILGLKVNLKKIIISEQNYTLCKSQEWA